MKELTVGGLLAYVGIGIVLPVRSSSLVTGLPVLMSAGASPAALVTHVSNVDLRRWQKRLSQLGTDRGLFFFG